MNYAYQVTFKLYTPLSNCRGTLNRIVLGDCIETAIATFYKAYPPIEISAVILGVLNIGVLADSRDIFADA